MTVHAAAELVFWTPRQADSIRRSAGGLRVVQGTAACHAGGDQPVRLMWKKQKRGGVAILGSGKAARNTQLKQKSTQGGVDSVDSVERGTVACGRRIACRGVGVSYAERG
jgi:hypothetical protein